MVITAPQVARCGRVLELQTLPVLGAHPVRAGLPAVLVEQCVCGGKIKFRARPSEMARIHLWRMVCAGCPTQPTARDLDQRCLVDRHRCRLAHLRIVRQHLIVEVEVERLEVFGMRVRYNLVASQRLVDQGFGHIQEPGRVGGACLQVRVVSPGAVVGADDDRVDPGGLLLGP